MPPRRSPRLPPQQPLALAALALIMLAGCGKSLPSHTVRSQAADSGGTHHAEAPPTRTQALAFARAVNLRPADVPHFTPTSPQQPESPSQKRLEAQLHRCTGSIGAVAHVAEVPSSHYRLKRGLIDLGVSSEVSVAQSAPAASTELQALRSKRVPACFARYLDLLLREERSRGATPRPVSIATGTPPAPGAAGSFAWRITATFTVQGVPFSLYVDILGFVVGPSRVTLVSSGALRPFPAVIQQQLFNLLLGRATKLTP